MSKYYIKILHKREMVTQYFIESYNRSVAINKAMDKDRKITNEQIISFTAKVVEEAKDST